MARRALRSGARPGSAWLNNAARPVLSPGAPTAARPRPHGHAPAELVAGLSPAARDLGALAPAACRGAEHVRRAERGARERR